MFISIVKYKVVDMKLALTKTTSFIFTLLLFSASFLFVDFGIEHQGYAISYIPKLIYFMYFAISCATFNRIREFIHMPLEKRILKGYHNTSKIIADLLKKGVKIKDPKELFREVVLRFKADLGIEHIFYLIPDTDDSNYGLYRDDTKAHLTLLSSSNELIKWFKKAAYPVGLHELKKEVKEVLDPYPISSGAIVYPIKENQHLKAIIIFCGKSKNEWFSANDMEYISIVIDQMMMVFNRLYDQCKLEELNRQLEEVQSQLKEKVSHQAVEIQKSEKMRAEYKLAWQFRYSDAGIGVALLLRKGELRELREGGFMLGGVEESLYSEGTIELERGDKMIIASDGITDIKDSDQNMLGEDRLFELITELDKKENGYLYGKLVNHLESHFSKENLNDDVTLIVIEIK